MAAKGIKFVLTIRALLYAADTLFIFLRNKVIIEEMIDLPYVWLEVGSD